MALDLQILITLCVFPSESHSPLLRKKEAKGRAPGHLQYKWRLKARVCDPGRAMDRLIDREEVAW